MTVAEQKQELTEIRRLITERRDSTTKLLTDAKDEQKQLFIKSVVEMQSYTIKIAELSLLVGAAIIPIILVVTKKTEIPHPGFVFVAAAIYLINGAVALWRSKDQIEDRVMAFDPANLLEAEADTLPMIFVANKLYLDPTNSDYIEEYRETEKEFISGNAQSRPSKKNINLWLDSFVSAFIFASLALLRPLWPVNIAYYWITVVIFVVLIVILVCSSITRVRVQQAKQEAAQKRVDKLRQDFANWHIAEVLEKQKIKSEDITEGAE